MKKRVLIIEDEATQVLLLTMQLRREGYETDAAMTGTEGLRKALSGQPDVILLDLMLPEMNGVDVCRHIRQNEATKDTPIILLTASSMSNLAKQCHAFNIAECLVKPYQTSTLLEHLAFILKQEPLLPV